MGCLLFYAGQQDNSTVSIASRTMGGGITERDFHAVGGGESAHVAPHPENPNIVYAGSYSGFLTRYDHTTGERRNITVYPDNPMGHGVKDMKFRFQWNFPIEFDPFDSDVLYVGSQHLHRSTDEGVSWEVISPDLSTNTVSMQDESGGPITKDDTGVEYYCTVFVIKPSTHEKGVIWFGTDDGRVHITKNGGKTWKNISADLPQDLWVSNVYASNHDEKVIYASLDGYRWDNFSPYLFKSKNYGKTWESISSNLPDSPINVVIEDNLNKNILYVGNDHGVYISLDQGKTWEPFSKGLTSAAVHDLVIQTKEKHLLVGTHGRSIYLADIKKIQDLSDEILQSSLYIYPLKNVKKSNSWGVQRSIWSQAYTPKLDITLFSSLSTDYNISINDSNGNNTP